MRSSKINFTNAHGEILAGRLDLPANQDPHNFAIFAHCFTCTKDFSAVRNVSRALASQGFGVLRFDFTGLGDSDGDFADTNFSSNVDDLISAADFLAKEYKAPSLLVGHSLGGAAAIFAGGKIDTIKAVATIGAPSNPVHVQKQLGSQLSVIKDKGQANVKLAGRDFTFKKQFIDNLEENSCVEAARNLHEALLILHSPQDATVSIKNAEEIYHAAHHPKSFVTLDGSEHLLIDKENAAYVGKIIAGWAARYIPQPVQETIKTTFQVVASLDEEDGFTTLLKLGNHHMKADEPVRVGGNDYGPTPYELLAGSLSACTAMTIQMYTKRKKWVIENVEVHTSYSKTHAQDCVACEDNPSAKIDTFHREIKITSDLDEKQLNRLLQIADKCPVHKTLHSETQVITTLR
ncbi:bifunctional alpha/beta hydrolase/OsmC family protein [Dokdonia donghaensis]|uniref:Osmotically inducible protein C n=1 Tax=Dokdonia donghaensis DSW-1 TaxID=1300343 RepID=A0A0A2GRB3_9FLAO|nr:bifunctional alpha/beta hydrolase/OsmC family protein [Dokdonia donghaensis]ANH60914.1 Alpha/beta hydrolase family protein [Dokdonia donghaensis DSW-1]KGO05839.1 osmotically inducible protein C [Dokdonia donghaensis DSW-1]